MDCPGVVPPHRRPAEWRRPKPLASYLLPPLQLSSGVQVPRPNKDGATVSGLCRSLEAWQMRRLG
jgi:hypothetical protein